MNKEIPIFFTIDDKYAPYADVAIRSIKENASKEERYKIFILHDGLSRKNQEIIENLATDKFQIVFKEMKEGLESITDRVENRLRCDYFTLTIYFRLFIPDMFPEYDKGIYIDSDIVVPGDISELYHKELGDNFIGACPDFSIQGVPPLINYLENAIGVNRLEYINSGVLLMNLKALREKEFTKHFLTLLNKYHFDSVAPDQDYLNAICNGKILYLGEEWDAMPTEEGKELENPKLIHYNLFQKPWCYDHIGYADYFWKYAKESAYYEAILEHKKNYSDEQKESDKNALGLIVSKGELIANTYDITFKKILESGEKVRL